MLVKDILEKCDNSTFVYDQNLNIIYKYNAKTNEYKCVNYLPLEYVKSLEVKKISVSNNCLFLDVHVLELPW